MSYPPSTPGPPGGRPPSYPPQGPTGPPGPSGPPPGGGYPPSGGQPPYGGGTPYGGSPQGWGGPPGPPRRNYTPLIIAIVLLLAIGGGVAAFLVTSGDDDDAGGNGGGNGGNSTQPTSPPAERSPEEQAYIDPLASRIVTGGNGVYTQESAECIAGSMVDVIGLETLQQAVSAEELSADPNLDLTTRGIEVNEDIGNQVYDRSTGCTDFRQLFLDAIAGEGLTDDQIECVDENIDDDIFRRLFVAGFTQNTEAADEALADLEDSAAPCENA